MKNTLLTLAMLTLAIPAQAGNTQPTSKYAGEEKRAIKSLSQDDIAELRRGGGWGLAKAAELNGVPGPAHLLEMKDKIPLDEAQIAAISAIFKGMQKKAMQQGETLIALETELESHFQNRTISDEILRASLSKIAAARMELRYTHLATHLKTPEILSDQQISKYNTLRGYGNLDPCANIPQGHNAAMWKKHNGCE